MGNSPSGIKKFLNQSTVDPETPDTNAPLQEEYGRDAAYTMIAYDSQAPNSVSKLDNAKLNFEKKYRRFLAMYGQYSNTPLTLCGSNETLQYPIVADTTNVFKYYPSRTPG